MSRTGEKETFKVLDGAQVDYGGRYEYLMTAYVSMKLVQDPAVEYFKLANNHESFGKFDDLVVETTLRNGETETWAVQLKHSKTGKIISKNELAAEGRGDFSINKYFQDYKKRQYPENTRMILYTNRQLDEEKQFEFVKKPYVVRTHKCACSSFLNTSGNNTAHQLSIEVKSGAETNQELEEYAKFFQNFCIYSNQKNVAEIEQELAQLFATFYQSDGQDKFKKYFETWCREEPVKGCKNKLYRDDIVLKLQKILLEPYIKPVVPKVSNAKGTLLKTIISKFDVTVIKEDCGKYIENLWKTSHYHSDSAPCIIKVDQNNMSTVCKAIDLYKRSFVLIGDCLESNRLNHLRVFRNLSDLQDEDYKTVTDNLSCVMQGRERRSLSDILTVGNDKLRRCFEVGHLLRMVENETVVIGDDTVELPTAYINRSIPKHVFNFDLIKNVGHKDIVVISCSDFDKLQQTVADLKHVKTKMANHNIVNRIVPLIITMKNKCSTDCFAKICSESGNKNVYCFEMLENHLNLLNSHGNLSNLLKYREIVADTVQDSDILNNFMNKTNVLLGDAGMGKTICADFIKRICPFDLWPIKVNLREKLEVFRKFNCDDLLKQILGSLELACFRNCYESEKKILLIWDGLDEVESKNVDGILEKIQEFSRQGYVQWITSRCHLKEKLENTLNVISINLLEITVNDQRNYIATRLKKTYKHIQEVTDSIHERVIDNKLKDFLGIPLLLFMFTEICLDPVKYQQILENEINLIQIYGMFIDGKFDHFNNKIMKCENALFSKIEDEIKDYRGMKYQKAALRTCFDIAFLDKFDANCDGFLKKIANDGDVYGIITKIGDDHTPIFVHKCFAEYFAACYLSREYQKVDKKTLKVLFQPEYKNIRFLFDLFLSENNPAHLAVLELNLDKLKNISPSLIFDKDKGGRNVFHLVSSYGAKRLPLQELYSKKPRFSLSKNVLKTFDSAPLDSSEQENEDYKKILEYLLDLVKNLEDLTYKDQIYELDFVEYANISMSLYAIDAYSKILECKQVLYNNYKDCETILAYSVIFNYENLFSNLQNIPYFELDRVSKPIRTSGFQHFDKFDIIILMIEYNRVEMLRKALKNRNVNNHINQMYDNENSLSWAVRKGNLDIVTMLVRKKVDTAKVYDEVSKNILHIAVTQRQANIVEYIVQEKFVSINALNSSDKTPLLIATMLGDYEISKYLINNGAAVDVKNFYGENILHNACKSGSLQLVQYLVLFQGHKRLLETVDSFRNTPLLTAARAKNLQIFNFLIEAGANISAKNAVGWNILHCACSAGRFDLIRNLSKEDLIKLDTQDLPKDTPILVAARYGHFNMVKYLLENGADVLANNFLKKNILHYACQHGNVELVKGFSLENFFALSSPDSEGHEPLFYAEKGSYSDIVQYIKNMQESRA